MSRIMVHGEDDGDVRLGPHARLRERLDVVVAALYTGGAGRCILSMGDVHVIYVPMSEEEKDVCGIDRKLCTTWMIRLRPSEDEDEGEMRLGPYVGLRERLEVEVGGAALGTRRRALQMGDDHVVYVPMSDEEKKVCGIDRNLCATWAIRVMPRKEAVLRQE